MYSWRSFSGVPCISSGELISGCTLPEDVDHPESQEVLASSEVCLQLVDDASLGLQLPSSGSDCPCLPVSCREWAGPQPASSAQAFVL